MTNDIIPIWFHVTVSQYVVAHDRKISLLRALHPHLVVELLQYSFYLGPFGLII